MGERGTAQCSSGRELGKGAWSQAVLLKACHVLHSSHLTPHTRRAITEGGG